MIGTSVMKALRLLYRSHFFAIPNLVRFWYKFLFKKKVPESLPSPVVETSINHWFSIMIRVIVVKKGQLQLSLGRASLKFFVIISWTYLRWDSHLWGAYLWTPSSVNYGVVLSTGVGRRSLSAGSYLLNFTVGVPNSPLKFWQILKKIGHD